MQAEGDLPDVCLLLRHSFDASFFPHHHHHVFFSLSHFSHPNWYFGYMYHVSHSYTASKQWKIEMYVQWFIHTHRERHMHLHIFYVMSLDLMSSLSCSIVWPVISGQNTLILFLSLAACNCSRLLPPIRTYTFKYTHTAAFAFAKSLWQTTDTPVYCMAECWWPPPLLLPLLTRWKQLYVFESDAIYHIPCEENYQQQKTTVASPPEKSGNSNLIILKFKHRGREGGCCVCVWNWTV